MKKVTILLAVFMAVSGLALAAGTIVGSAHDLRAIGGGTPTGTGLLQVCVPCHTPHQALTANAQDPLWNHTVSSAASYGTYSSTTLNATPVGFGGGTTPGTLNVSQLCMSCHDGTVSVLSMYQAPVLGGTPAVAVVPGVILASGQMDPTAGGYIGTNLTDDHPVNFSYTTALATADGGLYDPAGGLGSVVLFNNSVQCGSCHDVHDPTFTPFLVADNNASALCLTCHIK